MPQITLSKLKILHYSDLHLNSESNIDEFVTYLPDESKYDIVILSGDITNGNITLIKKLVSKFTKPVYFVCGNHDYYGSNILNVHDYLMNEKLNLLKEGVSYIYNHNGVDYTIAGATLWTSFLLEGRKARHAARIYAQNYINDFNAITYGKVKPYGISKLTPDVMEYLHLKDWKWLATFKDKPNTIIVTHFPCSKIVQHEKWNGNVLNPYFINNKITTGFNLILSGHTHDCFEGIDKYNCTHHVNALGYRHEFDTITENGDSLIRDNGFNSYKIIEY